MPTKLIFLINFNYLYPLIKVYFFQNNDKKTCNSPNV